MRYVNSISGADFLEMFRKENEEIQAYLEAGRCVFRETREIMCGAPRGDSTHPWYCPAHIAPAEEREKKTQEILRKLHGGK